MREVKWVYSFIRGKNIFLMMLAWLAGIVSVVLLIVEPKIISHIVDNILKPMFDDSSVSSGEVLEQVVPLLLIALAVVITRALLKFWANVERDEIAYRALLILREDLYEKDYMNDFEEVLNKKLISINVFSLQEEIYNKKQNLFNNLFNKNI